MIRVTFDLDATEFKQLKVKVAQDSLSMSDVFRSAVKDYTRGSWVPQSAVKQHSAQTKGDKIIK